jgi:hypothetical protein
MHYQSTGKRRPSRGFKSSVNPECDGECWAATRVGANSDSDTDYHPKSLSVPTSSQPGRARASGRSTQGGTVAAETGWTDTPLVRASALHGVSGTSSESHLGSTLMPGRAVLTGGVFRCSGSVAFVRADASPNEVLAKKCCTPARGRSTRMFDNCQCLTNSLCHCPSRYCVQTGVVVCAHAATSRLKERRLLMMSPRGQQLFRSRRAAPRASRRKRWLNVRSCA